MRRILIVDDDPGFRKLLSVAIRREGYEVEMAGEGREAVASIEKRAPDLVVLDIVMPVMSGYEVIHHIKFNQKLAHLPILVVTSNESLINPELSQDIKVDFLRKDSSPKLIIERIKKFFEGPEAVKNERAADPEAARHKKLEGEAWAREMRLIENYVREALNRNKNKVGIADQDDDW